MKTYEKLKLLAKANNMDMADYLKYIINELFDLRFYSVIGGQDVKN